MPFKIVSENQPKGDQPQAIEELFKGLKANKRSQVLLGVTGCATVSTVLLVQSVNISFQGNFMQNFRLFSARLLYVFEKHPL